MKNIDFNTVKTKTDKTVQEVIQARDVVMNNIRNTLEFDIDNFLV